MDDRLDRFRKRKEQKGQFMGTIDLSLSKIDENIVNGFANSEINSEQILATENKIKSKYDVDLTSDIDNSKAIDLLFSLNQSFDNQRMGLLISDCKNSVLDNIIRPFGIAKYIVAKYDKNGGNVDTIHNARANIYATDKEELKGENIPEYNSSDYHSDIRYINKNREGKEKKDNNQLVDGLTGKIILKGEESNLDHTISANEIHLDKGRILADINGIDLANSETNLNHTNESLNKSKKAKSMDEFVAYLDSKKEEREIQIKELSLKTELTVQERKKLNKLIDLNNFNKDLALSLDKKARGQYEKKVKEYYKSKKFVNNSAKTTTIEGAKMGLQQAVGIVLKELTESIFDEISDIYHCGFIKENKIGQTFLNVLKERLLVIGNRVLSKWSSIVDAFEDGFFSGFLSNIVTVIINMFVKTSKRVVRLLREGFFSLVKAFSLLFFPPEDLTLKEAAHEATKLLVAGLAITGGILLEQYVDTLLNSMPFANLVSTVLIGILTGLSTSLLSPLR